MSTISTRWEWRVFAPHLKVAEAWLSTHEHARVQESDETGFLSPPGGFARARDGLIDVNVLRETGRDGLECWERVMKAEFPLRPDGVTSVFKALQLAAPALDRAVWTDREFIHDFAGSRGPLRAVRVRRRCAHHAIAGCAVELCDVTADARRTRTFAIVSEDPRVVVDLVHTVGMNGWVNTGYPRGLAALLDGDPERYAVIDVGTNSVKLHVGEYSASGTWCSVVERADVTRLGEGLERTGEIGPAALQRTTASLQGMVEEARAAGARAIAAVGTAGLRLARNRAEVLAAIRESAGVTVEVISGEDEARLAYGAVVAWLGLGRGYAVVFDTGGGSSQFTFGRGGAVAERFSVDVGAVRYTENFGLAKAVTRGVIDDVMAALRSDFGRLDDRGRPDALVGMGGAVTNMAAVKHGLAAYDPAVVQGSVLSTEEIDRQIGLFASRDADSRRSIVGLQPTRAEVILAGACIIRIIMEKLGADSLTVSDRGLRHGVLIERFGP